VLDPAVGRQERARREDDREGLRDVVQSADGRPAGQALAQVRAERDRLLCIGLAVDEGRERRRQALALLP
jgi:hypothetical protein